MAAGNSGGFDTGQEYLGNVYAKALLGVTEAARKTDLVLEEFDSLLVDVFDKLPQFEATLASLRVKHEEKLVMLDRAFAGKMSAELLNFLKVVSRHGRLDCLRAINRIAHERLDELRGRVTVELRTAEPLDAATLEQVRGKVSGMLKREVKLLTKIDPSIVGGLIIRVGDTVYDASLAARLRQMRETAVEQSFQKIRQAVDRFVAG